MYASQYKPNFSIEHLHIYTLSFQKCCVFVKLFLFLHVICRELGSKEREIMQKMAEIAQEGFLLKQQLIQEAKSGLEDKKVWMERKWLVFMKSQDPEYWHMQNCSAKYSFIQMHYT